MVVIRQLTALAWFELPSGMPLSDKTRYDEQLTVVLIFILFGYLTWTDAWRNWFKLIFLIAPTGIILLRYMWSYFLALSRNLYVEHAIFSRKICLYHPLLLPCLSLSNWEMDIPLFSKINMPIYVIAASYNVASSITISNPERFLHCIIFWIQNTIDVQ